jgi:antitoxin VapB
MALNIKSAETERVVRELAKRTGLSVTEAVRAAAEEKLRGLEAERDRRRRALYDIIDRGKDLPALEARSDDEILGYNDRGTLE